MNISKWIATLFLLCLAFGISGCIPNNSKGDPFKEEVVQKGTEGKIVIIDLEGTIMDGGEGGPFGQPTMKMTDWLDKQFEMAADDKQVAGVIFNINSPGGGVDASEKIFQSAKRFKATGKKLYVQMNGMAASGGYYVSMAADKIYAHPTTLTGSIGVISMIPDLSGGLSKLGIRMNIIKSGEKKDWINPFHGMGKDETAYLQAITDNFYGRFKEVVVEGRKGKGKFNADNINNIATGEVFTAKQAEENGLIDAQGFLRDSIDAMKEDCKSPKAKVVRYKHAYNVTIGIAFAETPVKNQIYVDNRVHFDFSHLLEAKTPQFLFLWMGGE